VRSGKGLDRRQGCGMRLRPAQGRMAPSIASPTRVGAGLAGQEPR
jgi:hypothetical protein